MSSSSPKRRKLGHDFTDSAPIDQNQNDEVSNNASGNNEDAPIFNGKPARPQTRLKRSGEGQDGALYTGGLFKSSLFKFQVDDLLEHSRPNYEKVSPKINELLGKLKSLIESIDS